jgi:hypothetical protein
MESFFLIKDTAVEEKVDAIKSLSWRWFIARKKGGVLYFFRGFLTLFFVLISYVFALVLCCLGMGRVPYVLFPALLGLVLFVLLSLSI